jgi:hypothetical protein
VRVRRHNVRAFVILLLIAATLSLQAASLPTDHSPVHATHCCVFCHFAHLALTNPAQALTVKALVLSEWHVAIQKSCGRREALIAPGQSRAPPA